MFVDFEYDWHFTFSLFELLRIFLNITKYKMSIVSKVNKNRRIRKNMQMSQPSWWRCAEQDKKIKKDERTLRVI